MFDVPDKITIFCNNRVIYTTGDMVSGSKSVSVNFNNRMIKVVIEGNNNQTQWNCKINCPN
jgi:hypothetical protein